MSRLVLTLVLLYFIFHGEPDVFDLVHQKVMIEMSKK